MARGAGGTSGGIWRFAIGLVMMVAGGYLFLDSIRIGFGLGYGLYRFGGFTLTSGMVLVPFIFGIGIIFYNYKNILGWLLAGGSLVALSFGVIRGIKFNLAPMSAFDLIVILVLLVGGIGLFISSFKDMNAKE